MKNSDFKYALTSNSYKFNKLVKFFIRSNKSLYTNHLQQRTIKFNECVIQNILQTKQNEKKNSPRDQKKNRKKIILKCCSKGITAIIIINKTFEIVKKVFLKILN